MPAEPSHPVDRLFNLLSNVAPYPNGIIPIPQRIPATAFFPGGPGLWGATPDNPLPPMPISKIMIVGQDFDCEANYRKSFANLGENLKGPTWRQLLALLHRASISPADCFFTNFFMGLRQGDHAVGPFPGSTDPAFVQRCRDFFLLQLQAQRPRLILVLGIQVPRHLAPLSPELAPWLRLTTFPRIDAAGCPLIPSATFMGPSSKLLATVAILTHPCYRHSNARHRRYASFRGEEAELLMLQDAQAHAGIASGAIPAP